jgi:hypothetical protein
LRLLGATQKLCLALLRLKFHAGTTIAGKVLSETGGLE